MPRADQLTPPPQSVYECRRWLVDHPRKADIVRLIAAPARVVELRPDGPPGPRKKADRWQSLTARPEAEAAVSARLAAAGLGEDPHAARVTRDCLIVQARRLGVSLRGIARWLGVSTELARGCRELYEYAGANPVKAFREAATGLRTDRLDLREAARRVFTPEAVRCLDRGTLTKAELRDALAAAAGTPDVTLKHVDYYAGRVRKAAPPAAG